MNYLHQEFDLSPSDVVEVTLVGQANVMLLDPTNFENYRNGRQFRYYGGLGKNSPVLLKPPQRGHWHLVVDLGGNAGTVRAGVRVLSGSEA